MTAAYISDKEYIEMNSLHKAITPYARLTFHGESHFLQRTDDSVCKQHSCFIPFLSSNVKVCRHPAYSGHVRPYYSVRQSTLEWKKRAYRIMKTYMYSTHELLPQVVLASIT